MRRHRLSRLGQFRIDGQLTALLELERAGRPAALRVLARALESRFVVLCAR
jgi:hypothetical protein|nr:hypothetical protein [Kofleriaceae bacterium]